MLKHSILPLRSGRRPDNSRRWFVPQEKPWYRQLYDHGVSLGPSGPRAHYRYTPLADGEIRVLYIEHTDDFDAPIHCTLKHGPIHWTGDFDPYITLSYCWGALKDDGSHLDKVVHCDGGFIGVTSNLETALRYIRQKQDVITHDLFAEPGKYAQVPIWIDGICIDQTNTTERSHQVEQMAKIYMSSSRLVVWLGTPTETTLSNAHTWSEAQLRDELRKGGISRSPWYSRRWVIEEYGLTPIHSRYFLFGSFWSPCHEIHRILSRDLDKLQYALAKYDWFGVDPSNSLLYNLYRFDGAACSNTHDLIYSLLPLSFGSPEIRSITIDYSQRIEDLFVDVARSIIQTENAKIDRLVPLLAVASAKNARRGAFGRLPSWVPDWTIASNFMLGDHEQTVEDLLQKFAFDHHVEGASVQDLSVSKGLKAVERRRLLLKGRLLKPCFPPAHRRAADSRTDSGQLTQYCGPLDDQRCWTCQVFEVWERLEPADQNALKLIDEKTHALFMTPGSNVMFLLWRCRDVSSDVFELEYCFRASQRDPRDDVYDESESSWERRRKSWISHRNFQEAREIFFRVLDNITLL